MKREKNKCKLCGIKLDTAHKGMRLCPLCAKSEADDIVKFLSSHAIVGAVLAAIVLGIIALIKINYTPSDIDYNRVDMFTAMTAGFQEGVGSMTAWGMAAVGAALFVAPFGFFSGQDSEYAEREDRARDLGVPQAIGSPGSAGVLMKLSELCLAVFTGPVNIIYKLIRLLAIKRIRHEAKRPKTDKRIVNKSGDVRDKTRPWEWE